MNRLGENCERDPNSKIPLIPDEIMNEPAIRCRIAVGLFEQTANSLCEPAANQLDLFEQLIKQSEFKAT